MKCLMKIRMPNPHANDLIKDPEFGKKMQKALDEVKAEAAYFTLIDGSRGGYVIVNVDDASQIPKLAEPFLLWMNAEIDFIPVMTPQDLGKAGPYIESAVRNWA